ncbi:MAG: PAS domain S-box protein [Methanosarcinaceae archaeon]|nr:PAS domain S-box protein [Methanosarcinaceae archaeon]
MATKKIPNIVLADKDDMDIRVLEEALKANYCLSKVYSGKELLEKAKDLPDLILLGTALPDMTGYDVCNLLKNDTVTQFIPIVMIMSSSESGNEDLSIDAGADDYLTRPLDILELNTRARSLIRIKELHDSIMEERDIAQKYIDLAGSIFGVINKDFEVILVNKKAAELLGYPKEEITGQKWFDVFLPERIRDMIKGGYKLVLEGKLEPPEFSEKPILTKNGEERLVFWHDVVLKDEEGNILGTISSGEDITERKEAENALLKANEELRSLDTMKFNFLEDMSYELRTPIVSIKGFCELLDKGSLGPMTPDQKKALSPIMRNTERLRRLIESLLYLSTDHTQKVEYNFVPVDIGKTITNMVLDMSMQIKTKDLFLEQHISEDLPTINADVGYLENVIYHLLDNAIKFTPKGGKITIFAKRDGDYIHITLCDTGIGMPENKLQEIFDKFYQIDGSTKRKYGGAGVGLCICKRVVEDHGGEITVTSREGEGSSFYLKLPI